MSRILFFSRGRGHGHAVPDMLIAEELLAEDPTLEIIFVSYATGAATIAKAGWNVIDLGLPEANPYVATLRASFELVQRFEPALVIAHEEFAALVAAKMADRPSLFLSAWLPEDPSVAAESMACADAAIILEEPGLFAPPAGMAIHPLFVGPLSKKTIYRKTDRARARQELSLPETATVLSVVPGGFASETRAPIFPVVAEAFRTLPAVDKRLLWIGGPDTREIRQAVANEPRITVLDHLPALDQALVASDLVITKGTRGATTDASNLGIPSISLSHRLNPIDDQLVPRIRSNLSLNAKAVTGPILARYIMKTISGPAWPQETPITTTPADLAREMLRQLRRFEAGRSRDEADALLRS